MGNLDFSPEVFMGCGASLAKRQYETSVTLFPGGDSALEAHLRESGRFSKPRFHGKATSSAEESSATSSKADNVPADSSSSDIDAALQNGFEVIRTRAVMNREVNECVSPLALDWRWTKELREEELPLVVRNLEEPRPRNLRIVAGNICAYLRDGGMAKKGVGVLVVQQMSCDRWKEPKGAAETFLTFVPAANSYMQRAELEVATRKELAEMFLTAAAGGKTGYLQNIPYVWKHVKPLPPAAQRPADSFGSVEFIPLHTSAKPRTFLASSVNNKNNKAQPRTLVANCFAQVKPGPALDDKVKSLQQNQDLILWLASCANDSVATKRIQQWRRSGRLADLLDAQKAIVRLQQADEFSTIGTTLAQSMQDVIDQFQEGGQAIEDTRQGRQQAFRAMIIALVSRSETLAENHPLEIILPRSIGCGLAGGDPQDYLRQIYDMARRLPKNCSVLLMEYEEWQKRAPLVLPSVIAARFQSLDAARQQLADGKLRSREFANKVYSAFV